MRGAMARGGICYWKLLGGVGTSKASPDCEKAQPLYAGIIGILFLCLVATGSKARFRALFAGRV